MGLSVRSCPLLKINRDSIWYTDTITSEVYSKDQASCVVGVNRFFASEKLQFSPSIIQGITRLASDKSRMKAAHEDREVNTEKIFSICPAYWVDN